MRKGKQPVILQVLPALETGGVERGTVEIARAISDKGYKSLVASNGGYLEIELKQSRSQHFKLPLDSKNPFVMWLNIGRLKKIIEKYDVDIVHARSRAPAWSAYFAAKKTKADFLTTFHGLYSTGGPLKKLYNSIMVRGKRVIAISDFIADHLKEIYAVKDRKIKTIHRGVDTEYFKPESVNHERVIKLSKQWGIPDEVPIIMLPARLSRWKGQKFLIESLAELPHKNFLCIMVGVGGAHQKYLKELNKLIAQKNMEKNVKIVGATNDMPAAYMLATVVVSASTKPEAFGRVALEAAAMGRPVIATKLGGSMETIIDGETGFLVESGNTKEMAETINKVLGMSASARKKIASNAAIHVRENFSIKKMCDKTIKLYNEVLD